MYARISRSSWISFRVSDADARVVSVVSLVLVVSVAKSYSSSARWATAAFATVTITPSEISMSTVSSATMRTRP
jgi:hypothetical protein